MSTQPVAINNGAAARPQRPKVEFPFNTTVFVTLQRAIPAGPYDSQYGRSWLYTVTTADDDGVEKAMFLDDSQKQQIDALRARAGATLAITRKETRLANNKRGSEWIIADTRPAPPPPPPAPARAAEPPSPDRQIHDDLKRLDQHARRAAETAEAAMDQCYAIAVRAVARAQQLADEAGMLHIKFAAEDVRASAIALLIQRAHERRARATEGV